MSFSKLKNCLLVVGLLNPLILTAETQNPRIIQFSGLEKIISIIINKNDEPIHQDYFLAAYEPLKLNNDLMPFLVQKTNHFYSYIDSKGNWLSEDNFLDAFNFSKDKLAIIKTKKGYGAINLQGKLQIKDQFQDLFKFNNGYAVFKKNNLYGLINTNGKIILSGQTKNLGDVNEMGWFVNSYKNKLGIFDINGKNIVPAKFKDLRNFTPNGLAVAKLKDYYGIINKEGNFITPEKYTHIKNFNEFGYSIAQIEYDDKTIENFIINSKGKEVFTSDKLIKEIYPQNIAILEYEFCDYYSFIKKGYIKRGLSYCGPINSKGLAFYRNEDKWFLLNVNNGVIKDISPYNEPDFPHYSEPNDNYFKLVQNHKKISWVNQNIDIVYSATEKKVNDKYLIELKNKNNKTIWSLMSDHNNLYMYNFFERSDTDILNLPSLKNKYTQLSEELISKQFFIKSKKYKAEFIENFNPNILTIFKNKKPYTANSLIIASEHIDYELNNEYSFLIEQRNEVFDEVYQSIVAELSKKYGNPVYSNFSKNKIQLKDEIETKWKIKNKNLYLVYYFDYSKNDDFGYMIELIYK